MKQRVLTAIALAPIVLGALLLVNPWPLVCLAAFVAYVCATEVSSLLNHRSHLAGIGGAVALLVLVLLPVPDALTVGLSIVGIFASFWSSRTKAKWLIPVALFWAAAPLAAIVRLHGIDLMGLTFAVPLATLAIVPLWGGDTAAIFAGKAWGKHPLAPSISPKKTWEGAIANLVACLIVAWLLGTWIGTTVTTALLAGAIAGVFGQAGDLFESYIKRQANLKDSGSILPGHGGLMDRLDSTLFTAPLVLLVVSSLGSPLA